MQLVPKCLLCGAQIRVLSRPGVDRKDGCSGEAEQVIVLKCLGDGLVHISELAAVALVKNDDDMLAKDGVTLVLPHENIQLLNGGDDDFRARVLQLLLQHGGVGIAVGRALFKAVVLLHGLVW